MDVDTTLITIRGMSIDDRIRLVQAIWDEIAVEAGRADLTEAQKQELDRRLADDDANPEDCVDWEVVKADAKARSRR